MKIETNNYILVQEYPTSPFLGTRVYFVWDTVPSYHYEGKGRSFKSSEIEDQPNFWQKIK